MNYSLLGDAVGLLLEIIMENIFNCNSLLQHKSVLLYTKSLDSQTANYIFLMQVIFESMIK